MGLNIMGPNIPHARPGPEPLQAKKPANPRAATNGYLPSYKNTLLQAAKTGLFYSGRYPDS